MKKIGETFANAFCHEGVTKVLTLESSGISPALMTAYELGVPLLVARKRKPVTLSENLYTAKVYSIYQTRRNGNFRFPIVSPSSRSCFDH